MYDLNVPWPLLSYTAPPLAAQMTNLCNTLAMLYSLGYRYIAINFVVQETVKLPLNNPDKLNPIPIETLRKKMSKYEGLRLFTRITLVITDPAKCQSILKFNASSAFDLISVQPTTEKALQLTTTNLDIDIVSLPMAARLPFFVKHKTVGQALEKGMKFEICYLGLISGPAMYELSLVLGTTGHLSRKNFIGNVLQVIRASRNRGLVFSSGALEPMHARNYSDILAIMDTLGLKVSNGKDGFVRNPELALMAGRLRIKSNKQTVMIGNQGGAERASAAIIDEITPKKLESTKRSKNDPDTAPAKRRKQ